jgi:undecaprenyl-diphosphatase
MEELNLFLFLWIAAGHAPCPWLVSAAGALAVGGPWLCLGLLGWTAWLHPRECGYLLAVLGCAALASMLAHALAAALNMPQPFMVGLSPAYIEHGARGSLPSAHATVMFTVALLCLRRPALQLRYSRPPYSPVGHASTSVFIFRLTSRPVCCWPWE